MNTKNDAARAERLKAALRDNLRRRKAQGRARAETSPENPAETSAEDSGAPPDPTGEPGSQA
jgi:hypothetical protein